MTTPEAPKAGHGRRKAAREARQAAAASAAATAAAAGIEMADLEASQLAHLELARGPVAEGYAAPRSAEVVRARLALNEARGQLGRELDGLTSAAQSALDIPAKIRRDPIKTVALAGGAGFLLLGGPRRLIRAAGSRLLPQRKRDVYDGLLPDEIERILRDSGAAKEPGVRDAVAADFAEYLRSKGRFRPQPDARSSFWRTYDTLVGPLGTVGARLLVERLFAVGRGTGGTSSPGGGKKG
jgi:hypothetical protein